MAPKTLPSRELVRQLLWYDVTTGEFTWLPRPREMFTSHRQFLNWNSRYPRQHAGSLYRGGYLAIGINYTKYLAHRLAWLFVYGEPVPDSLDHIDGDKLNNRITNLRVATHSQNMANAKRWRNHSIGVKGVVANHGRFSARLRVDGKSIYLGSFATIEEAAEAYRIAAIGARGDFARWD